MSSLWLPIKASRAEPLARIRAAEGAPTWQDGYSQGLDEGLRLAHAELAADRTALAAMMGELEALRPPSRDHLSALIAEVVTRLVTQVAGAAAVDEALLISRAKAAADALANEPDTIVIHVHPGDATLIAGEMPFTVVGDASMARGSVRAEADDSWAADGIQEALARVQAELGR